MLSTRSSPLPVTATSLGATSAENCTVSTLPAVASSSTIVSWPLPRPNRYVSLPAPPISVSSPGPPPSRSSPGPPTSTGVSVGPVVPTPVPPLPDVPPPPSPNGGLDGTLTESASPSVPLTNALSVPARPPFGEGRSAEHTSELQSLAYLVCRLPL